MVVAVVVKVVVVVTGDVYQYHWSSWIAGAGLASWNSLQLLLKDPSLSFMMFKNTDGKKIIN